MYLIQVKEQNGTQVVSARELYLKLGYDKSQYSRWYKKNIIENDFANENIDYQRFDTNVEGSPTIEFALSLDFAKKLCMIAKTKLGEQFRDYFIECEKKLKQVSHPAVPTSFTEALKLAYEQSVKIEEQQKQLETQKPLVVFAEALQISNHCVLIGELAKILKQNGVEIGQNRLFEFLRSKNYLMSKGEQRNLPTQRSLEMQLFEVKTTTINNPDGSIRVSKTTKVTPRGQEYFINKFISERNKLLKAV